MVEAFGELQAVVVMNCEFHLVYRCEYCGELYESEWTYSKLVAMTYLGNSPGELHKHSDGSLGTGRPVGVKEKT